MNLLSPVVNNAFRMLRQDLYLHFESAESLTAQDGAWSEKDAETARSLIEDLVAVIRGVAALHDTPVTGGHCRTCDGIWPCQAFETLHRLVKDPQRQFVKIVTQRDE